MLIGNIFSNNLCFLINQVRTQLFLLGGQHMRILSSITCCTMEEKTKAFQIPDCWLRLHKEVECPDNWRQLLTPPLKLQCCLIRTQWKEVYLNAQISIVATQQKHHRFSAMINQEALRFKQPGGGKSAIKSLVYLENEPVMCF